VQEVRSLVLEALVLRLRRLSQEWMVVWLTRAVWLVLHLVC